MIAEKFGDPFVNAFTHVQTLGSVGKTLLQQTFCNDERPDGGASPTSTSRQEKFIQKND